MIMRYFRRPALSAAETQRLMQQIQLRVGIEILELVTEIAFYVECSEVLYDDQKLALDWHLTETFDPDRISFETALKECATVIEVGPRLSFETPFSSSAVSMMRSLGIDLVTRVERFRRYGFTAGLTARQEELVASLLCDRMTETVYTEPLRSFVTGSQRQPTRVIDISGGPDALLAASRELNLGVAEADAKPFYQFFTDVVGRNPFDIELFELAQGNSEHCRHPFFRGQLVVNNQEIGFSLMDLIKRPLKANPGNSLIAFKDDSSAISGQWIETLVPVNPGDASVIETSSLLLHPTLTAETHNFPTGVAPYPGAATGTGGRIRDNQCVGRGGQVIASGAAYCVASLHIPGYVLHWEEDGVTHPPNLAAPLDILIQASNGASDYGNCFGEPLILGHVRSFGLQTLAGYRAWFKPIMYTEGVGQIDDLHVHKAEPVADMLIVQIGGPAYRIGMGGGSASSAISGANTDEVDFNAVQRPDPEMEQRVNRVIRACIELGHHNPIASAHDLGAGGDSNALPEIVYPAGGRIDLTAIPVGDSSLSALEIWGNESQERNVFLVEDEVALFDLVAICQREDCPAAVVGLVTGDGRLVVEKDQQVVVDLPLEPILGETAVGLVELKPLTVEPGQIEPLNLPTLTLYEALQRVLRHPDVASKEYLTRKVDRSVTGLVAQQQCVGPNQLPLSDYAVVAQSHFGSSGIALSQGEQPIIGLLNAEAGARMAVAEALLNLAGAKITTLEDIKCEANWMAAAKEPGEGIRLKDAAIAMTELMVYLGIAIDGGKDSLSMAAKHPQLGLVKAPLQLVVAPYAPMEDVSIKVTPDFKTPGNTVIFVNLSGGHDRLGGSVLARCYQRLGSNYPDVEPTLLLDGFKAVQELVVDGLIVSLHDRSDGGLITTLCEMAFGGNVGLEINLWNTDTTIPTFFSEELGLVMECPDPEVVVDHLQEAGLPAAVIGTVGDYGGNITIIHNDLCVLDESMVDLRYIWQETSIKLDELQTNPELVAQSASARRNLVNPPPRRLTFEPVPTHPEIMGAANKPKVAVVREQGSNGDAEMRSAFYAAGFEVWDVHMNDLRQCRFSLDSVQGCVFPGGFAYGDVLDSAKGWAGGILFNNHLAEEFDRFYHRPDTFSLGVCNGAQLMALLGWVPQPVEHDFDKYRFIRNRSGRFESDFVTVEIQPSPAIMLAGMAGSQLGVWVAHGEGYLYVPEEDDEGLTELIEDGLTPLLYIGPDGEPTTTYPFNPNGSPVGITALCTPDGRHLAMMPHPERSANQLWQMPWMPPEWESLQASPWLWMFQNAYYWCMAQQQNALV